MVNPIEPNLRRSQAYVDGLANIVERDAKAGKVKNVASYTLGALKTDYRPKKTFLDQEQESKQAQRKTEQAKAEKAEKIKNLVSEFNGIRIDYNYY